jgi:hypothetical protein
VDQGLTLFLYPYPTPISSGRLGSQAWKFLFGHAAILTRSPELALQSEYPLSHLVRFPTGSIQQDDHFIGHFLRPGSKTLYHYGSRPPPSHLLLKLRHLSRMPG